MARRGIKKRDYEQLDDPTVSRVISLLEQESPITKKAACEILNISYNTSRLNKIIEEYKDRQAFITRRFKENKGKVLSDAETKEMVIDYLKGESITNISKALYRSEHIIKKLLKDLNLPIRSKNSTYQKPDILPDEMIEDTFKVGEFAWSSRYNCVCQIKRPYGIDRTLQCNVYIVWVFGKYNQFALQPSYELGKLDVLKQFDLTSDTFENTEKPNFNYRIE